MLQTIDIKLIDYAAAVSLQKRLVREVANGADDTLILCEHPRTITLGRKYRETNLFLSREDLLRQGFSIFNVDRGGDVTLHAPGQLVVYPVIDLKRAGIGLKSYLKKLEQVAVDLLADFAIVANGDDGNRGVWTGGRKIASIGIGVSRWVTYHGMGLNISTDLSLFSMIRACGLDVRMTSLSAESGRETDMPDIRRRVFGHFKNIFGC